MNKRVKKQLLQVFLFHNQGLSYKLSVLFHLNEQQEN